MQVCVIPFCTAFQSSVVHLSLPFLHQSSASVAQRAVHLTQAQAPAAVRLGGRPSRRPRASNRTFAASDLLSLLTLQPYAAPPPPPAAAAAASCTAAAASAQSRSSGSK